MNLNEFLTLLTRLSYFAIGLVTLLSYLRHRDRTRFDIMLVDVYLEPVSGIDVLKAVMATSPNFHNVSRPVDLKPTLVVE